MYHTRLSHKIWKEERPGQADPGNDRRVAEAKHAKTKKPKSQCFAEVHEEFKSAFQVHIYSILPEEQWEAAITFLGSRWAFYNPGQPLPEIFGGSHQPSLF